LVCIAAALAAVAGIGRLARAQDDHELDGDAEAAAAAVTRAAELEAQRQALEEKQDEQCYHRLRDELREMLDARLSSRLDELKNACRLTDAQVKKLTIAGHVDINRFMDRSDPLTRRFASLWSFVLTIRCANVAGFKDTVSEWRNLEREIRNAVIAPDSFFGKTLRRTLDPEQARRLTKDPAVERRPNSETEETGGVKLGCAGKSR
jgi:hypothetical protein